MARYGDSNGLDENLAYGMRGAIADYVIEAFNSDRPYDEFLQEQLAGICCRPRISTKSSFGGS